MSALTLRLRRPPARRVDLAPLVPNLLAGMNTRQIARIELWHGNQKVPVGDLFTLHGDSVERIVIQSDSDRLDRIGASESLRDQVYRGNLRKLFGPDK